MKKHGIQKVSVKNDDDDVKSLEKYGIKVSNEEVSIFSDKEKENFKDIKENIECVKEHKTYKIKKTEEETIFSQKPKITRRESAPNNLYSSSKDLLDEENKAQAKEYRNIRRKTYVNEHRSEEETENYRKKQNKSIVIAYPKSQEGEETEEPNNNKIKEGSNSNKNNKEKKTRKNEEKLKVVNEKETIRSRKNSFTDKNQKNIKIQSKSSSKNIEITVTDASPEKNTTQKPKGTNLQQKIIKSLNSTGGTYDLEKDSNQNRKTNNPSKNNNGNNTKKLATMLSQSVSAFNSKDF